MRSFSIWGFYHFDLYLFENQLQLIFRCRIVCVCVWISENVATARSCIRSWMCARCRRSYSEKRRNIRHTTTITQITTTTKNSIIKRHHHKWDFRRYVSVCMLPICAIVDRSSNISKIALYAIIHVNAVRLLKTQISPRTWRIVSTIGCAFGLRYNFRCSIWNISVNDLSVA